VKPRVGQQVDIVVKVTTAAGGAPKKPIQDPHFSILGGGIGGEGVQLAAMSDPDGMMFRTSFSFPAQGKYEVTFHGTSDAYALKATRNLVTFDVAATPAPPASAPAQGTAPPGDTATPAPSASVKWL
jgi:hypothetical protein